MKVCVFICILLILFQHDQSLFELYSGKGYHFWVDDDFESHRMKDSADIVIELVKLVDGFATAYIPQYPIV